MGNLCWFYHLLDRRGVISKLGSDPGPGIVSTVAPKLDVGIDPNWCWGRVPRLVGPDTLPTRPRSQYGARPRLSEWSPDQTPGGIASHARTALSDALYAGL